MSDVTPEQSPKPEVSEQPKPEVKPEDKPEVSSEQPKPETQPKPEVSREEFSQLSGIVNTLAETVNKLIPGTRDESPVKVPWTHRGWKP